MKPANFLQLDCSEIKAEKKQNYKAIATNFFRLLPLRRETKNQLNLDTRRNDCCGFLDRPVKVDYVEVESGTAKYRLRIRDFTSFSFFVYIFLLWTLIFSPMLNGFLPYSVLFRVIGGVTFAQACRPGGKNGGGPRPPRILVPFQRNEFVPKLSEQTVGASGPAEGPIYRDTKRYNTELVPNWNPDIIFQNEEENNEDRMMTQRCMDRLNVLSLRVMNEWPGVKLLVIEAWDDPEVEGEFIDKALHYEGRAVDIKTSDQDKSKYPLLARLAVEAGFDWVYYKNYYVHCSVKSESAGGAGSRGCFPGSSIVSVPGDMVTRLDQISPGDSVYSVDSEGTIVRDTLLTFMDIQHDISTGTPAQRSFISVSTDSGHSLMLTRNHLIHKIKSDSNSNGSNFFFKASKNLFTAIFAGNLKKGDYIYVADVKQNETFSAIVRPSKVTNIELTTSASGAFAPLTSRGTILVNGVMASCYAVIENEDVAHFVISPLRYYKILNYWFMDLFRADKEKNNSTNIYSKFSSESGILPYAEFLFNIGRYLIPEPLFWGD